MLDEKVFKTIKENNLIEKGDKIIVGVSGGPDSMCLLDILRSLKEKLLFEIFVCHVNHSLRKEADSETMYVQEYCSKNNIQCFVKKVEILKLASDAKVGTEEMGRNVRYSFFEEIAKKVQANKIATAHNSNDNCETVLMNLLRGSGISGLKGIEIKRKAKELTYIRPILTCTRTEVEEYCKDNKLQPKIDKTNFENIYTRNKIRNDLIPYLQKEFNPNILETLNRLSTLAKEEESYFEEIVKKEYENLKITENKAEIILDLKGFNGLQKVIKSRLLLYTITKLTGSIQGISKVHIEDIIKLCQNNIGNKYLTPNKHLKVLVDKGKIYITV